METQENLNILVNSDDESSPKSECSVLPYPPIYNISYDRFMMFTNNKLMLFDKKNSMKEILLIKNTIRNFNIVLKDLVEILKKEFDPEYIDLLFSNSEFYHDIADIIIEHDCNMNNFLSEIYIIVEDIFFLL